jgi:uncharacterized Tic20 family protein
MTQTPMPPPNPDRDVAPMSQADERTWAVLAHLSAFVAAVVSAGWLSFLGPLIVWAVYKDRSDLVRRSAAAAFNFNVGLWVATIVGWIFFITLIGIPIAIILWIVVFVASIVYHLLAAMAANRGEVYRYPWSITLLR